MMLFVAGLASDFDDVDLKEMFELYGEVTSARLITDRATGKSKGFGFVDMPNELEAKETITTLDGVMLQRKKISVKEAEAQQPRSSGGGGSYNSGGGSSYGNRDNRGGGYGSRDNRGGGYGGNNSSSGSSYNNDRPARPRFNSNDSDRRNNDNRDRGGFNRDGGGGFNRGDR